MRARALDPTAQAAASNAHKTPVVVCMSAVFCLLFVGLTPSQVDAGPAVPAATLPAFPPGQVAIRAWLEPEKVRLGQPFALRVDVKHPAGHKVELPQSIAWGKLQLAGPVDQALRQDGPDAVVETFRFPLQSFALDQVETPALQFRVPTLPQEEESLVVDPLPVAMEKSAPPDQDAQPAPMAPGVAILRKDPRFLAWPPLILFALLLWGALAFLDRRRPHHTAPAGTDAVVPSLPPHEWAAQQLAALRASGLLEAGQHAQFVDTAVQIARTYLERSYNVPVLEQTTHEAMAMLGPAVVRAVLNPQTRRLGKLPVNQVKAVLTFADAVKFARLPATTQDCAKLLEDVAFVVEVTRPQDEDTVPPQVPA